MAFRLLHIADPHFSRSFCIDEGPARGGKYAEEIRRVLSQHKLGSKPFNALIVSGDFTFGHAEAGFTMAEEFLKELEPLVSPDCQLLIPGNHDIDIGKRPYHFGRLSLPTEKAVAEQSYRDFLDRRGKHQDHPNFYLSDYLRIDGGSHGLVLVGLNSSRVERRDAQGWGYVGADQIWDLLDKVQSSQSAKPKDGDLVIIFVHHNLLPLWDVGLEQTLLRPEDRKFSFAMDAASILQTFCRTGVEVIFHGHTHVRSDKRVEGYGHDSIRAFVLGSGSFALRDSSCPPHHFQVIDVIPDRYANTDVQIYDLLCTSRSDNEPRKWTTSLNPLFLHAAWDSSRVAALLQELRLDGEEAVIDYEITRSWAVLRQWASKQQRIKLLAHLVDILAKYLPGISEAAIEQELREIKKKPPTERILSEFSLEQYLIMELRRKGGYNA